MAVRALALACQIWQQGQPAALFVWRALCRACCAANAPRPHARAVRSGPCRSTYALHPAPNPPIHLLLAAAQPPARKHTRLPAQAHPTMPSSSTMCFHRSSGELDALGRCARRCLSAPGRPSPSLPPLTRCRPGLPPAVAPKLAVKSRDKAATLLQAQADKVRGAAVAAAAAAPARRCPAAATPSVLASFSPFRLSQRAPRRKSTGAACPSPVTPAPLPLSTPTRRPRPWPPPAPFPPWATALLPPPPPSPAPGPHTSSPHPAAP